MQGTLLTDIGEFGLIERLVQAWEASGKKKEMTHTDFFGSIDADQTGVGAAGLRLGVGDDAAVIDVPAGRALLTTADMLVEGIHFLWSGTRARSLGRKAIAANISDIAAMGGVPGWALLSIGIPPGAMVEDVEELYAGMGEMASRYGVALAGGDTVRSEQWVISVTLLGIAVREPFTRRGGRDGDLILVTGRVGDAAAGLYLLLNKDIDYTGLSGEAEYLLSRHLDPTPRVREAMVLAEHGGVTAMIDVSDGVASEVHHICRNSGCGAQLDLASLPVSPQAQKLASVTGQTAINWALYGGEDYELLFTAPPDVAPDLIKHLREAAGAPATVIGRLTGVSPGVSARELTPGGVRYVPVPAGGYNHFNPTGKPGVDNNNCRGQAGGE